jgi:hypothetical protein
MSTQSATETSRRAAAARVLASCCACVLGFLALSACGSNNDISTRRLSPPTPLNVSVLITDNSVSISPSTLGGGPVTMIMSNQATSPQRVTVNDERTVVRSSTKFEPGNTGTMKLNVTEGNYAIRASSAKIAHAILRVGAMRPASQDDLHLP